MSAFIIDVCIPQIYWKYNSGRIRPSLLGGGSCCRIRRSLLDFASPWNKNPPKLSHATNYLHGPTIVRNFKYGKPVGFWLFGCCGMISVSVLLGGITRLTESGLSMVTWKLLGEKRPTNDEEWKAEFLRYQNFPEYQISNSSMTLEEFKFIYLMEYTHRMWGRLIGVFFLIPALYFWKRGYFNAAIKKRILLIAGLIGSQGLMGWHMVKSGLENRFDDVNDVPRVSQYRLACHLTLAFVLHVVCLSTALLSLLPPQRISVMSHRNIYFNRLSFVAQGITFLTAVSGAFVAGLDAGLVYSSFPKMADKWIPPELYSLEPLLKNFTENPVTTQFNHRLCGISTISVITLLFLAGKKIALPKRALWATNFLMIIAWLQGTLGVSTLLNHVPVSLAAAHQSMSLLLISVIVWLRHELKFIKFLPK